MLFLRVLRVLRVSIFHFGWNTAALEAGLAARVHADQLSWSGGTALAAAVGAITADHMEFATVEDARALAAAGGIGVLLPAANCVRHPLPEPKVLENRGLMSAAQLPQSVGVTGR